MKIIHTADLHIGQIIYQHYDRVDEHEQFFSQLSQWCQEEKPDALIVSGDIFDIQQPSATTTRWFTEHFVNLSRLIPQMTIVITAGNHDSASRLESSSALWKLTNTHIVGLSPSPDFLDREERWQEDYIVRLSDGYIVALPYISNPRTEVIQSILDYVAKDNKEMLPVVMTSHQTLVGTDATGHDFEIGTIRAFPLEAFGEGYDYLALGHIHKPQTIGHPEDWASETVVYPSPVARYSGSPLHVSCDEAYPHSVTVVEVDRRNGPVTIRQKRIHQLRHFYTLPIDGSSFESSEEAIEAVRDFAKEKGSGYIRLRVDCVTQLPPNFNQLLYDAIGIKSEEVRYNPKIIWTGMEQTPEEESGSPLFQIADLQEMKDPLEFISKTISQYPGLDFETIRAAFREIEDQLKER